MNTMHWYYRPNLSSNSMLTTVAGVLTCTNDHKIHCKTANLEALARLLGVVVGVP